MMDSEERFKSLQLGYDSCASETKESTLRAKLRHLAFHSECFSTVLDSLVINDMERYVSQGPDTQELPELNDSLSRERADQVTPPDEYYCGPRLYGTVTDTAVYSDFLTISLGTR